MSFRQSLGLGVPIDTLRVARAAFPKGNPYLTLRDELETIYADSFFRDLFPSQGQPAESPGRLALITVLQFAEDLPDRQAADAVRSRIDWKYLLGLPLDDPGFDFSILSEFRDRLLAGAQEQQLLDALLERFGERGLLNARGKQRTDSTHVQAAVRTLNRLECVGETLRHVLNVLATLAPEWLRERVPLDWYIDYATRFEQYRLPKKQTDRNQLALKIGQDGHRLLAWLFAPDTPPSLRGDDTVELLRQVWVQQYLLHNGEVQWREADNLPPSEQRIQSPYDVEARYSLKRQTEWFGYKTHLSETCDDDQPHFITHVETTAATVPDEQVIESIHSALAAKQLLPAEHLLDRGYVDTKTLISSQREHQVEVLGPIRVDTTWQAQTDDGLDVSCFSIDWDRQTVTCPQGEQSQVWTDSKDKAGNPTVYVRFAKLACGACPVRSRCTRSKAGPRTLRFKAREEYEQLHAARQRERTAEFKARYAKRAGIEGTLSQGTRAFGLRRSRYIGQAKTHLQHILIAVAMNLARFVAWVNKVPRTTTPTSAFAALAPLPI